MNEIRNARTLVTEIDPEKRNELTLQQFRDQVAELLANTDSVAGWIFVVINRIDGDEVTGSHSAGGTEGAVWHAAVQGARVAFKLKLAIDEAESGKMNG